MTEKSGIKLLKNLSVTDLEGEKVMIDFSGGKYFLLKGAANEIWDYIQSEITIGEIEERLMAVYDVDIEHLRKAVFDFVEQMKSYHFIEVMNE